MVEVAMVVKISRNTFYSMLNNLSSVPPESGGILGRIGDTITSVFFDVGLQCSNYSYIPDRQKLNLTIQKWRERGIVFCGLFHSHPSGGEFLSESDIQYAERILRSFPKDKQTLLFPIVIPKEKVVFYCARIKDNRIVVSEENAVLVE